MATASHLTYQEAMTSLKSDFTKLSLSSKEDVIAWLSENFPDATEKTILLKHLRLQEIVIIDKFYQSKGDIVTFYFRVYNKRMNRRRSTYCRHVTLIPHKKRH